MNVHTKWVVRQNKKVVFAVAGLAALGVAVGVHFFSHRHVVNLSRTDTVTDAKPPTEAAWEPATDTRKKKPRPASKKKLPNASNPLGPLIELIETQPVEARYDCEDDCPAGYDIINTTGSKTEARWLHAAGFPTVAEYKSLTENDAALAEAMRRSDAGDTRAAAILGHYFLQEKDYLESDIQLSRAALHCNVFAYRVRSQIYVEGPHPNMMLSAQDLRVAYLLGDQEAALELSALLEAANLTDRTALGSIDQVALAMLGTKRRYDPASCRYRGIRPRPGMRNLE